MQFRGRMSANPPPHMVLDSDQVRAAVPALASMLETLDDHPLSRIRYLDEAQRGDPHHYLSDSRAAGAAAARSARRAATELREVLALVDQTLTACDQHDQGVHATAPVRALPPGDGVPTALGVPAPPTPVAAAKADPVAEHPNAAFANRDPSPLHPTAIPTPAGVAALNGAAAPALAPARVAAVDARPPRPAPPDLAVAAPHAAPTPVALDAACPRTPVPTITPPPPPPPIRPTAAGARPEAPQRWWEALGAGWRGRGNALATFFGWLGTMVVAVGKGLANLLWGFRWGDPWFADAWGADGIAMVGAIVAGVVGYGDIRCIVRYWLIDPIRGEGDGRFNFTLGSRAGRGVVPVGGILLNHWANKRSSASSSSLVRRC